jgi:peptidoglycan/LPS O-acetylase OafA/YrhL
METKNRLGGADGVRALACLMVMGHHAFQRLALPAQSADFQEWQLFFLTGSAGVGVFFVLSGYLLSSPFWRAWREDRTRPSLATYALRRWARIAPGFWLNLTLTFVLSLSFVPNAPNLVWRFLSGLSFTSSLTWETLFPVEINGPLWSIGYEVFSYAALGVFLFLWFLVPGKRTLARGLGWWAGVLALTIVAHGLFVIYGQPDDVQRGWQYGMTGGAKYWWPYYNPVGFFATFVIGVLAAGVADGLGRVQAARPVTRWVWDAAVVVALVGWVALMVGMRHEPDFAFSWPTQPYYFPTFALLVGAVLALTPHSRIMVRVLDNPVARFVATISFGLYIWHYLLLEGSQLLWPDVHYFGITDLGDWAVKIGAIYGVAAVLATLSWYLFEKPIVLWSQKRTLGVK